MTTYEVSLVPPKKLYEIEDEVRNHLEDAIEMSNGRFSWDSCARDIEEGRNQLWIAFDAETLNIAGAIITKIETYPHKTMCCYMFCGGGNFFEWSDQIYALIQKYADEVGCDGSELFGRPGWQRVGRKYGWSDWGCLMEFYPEKAEHNYAG